MKYKLTVNGKQFGKEMDKAGAELFIKLTQFAIKGLGYEVVK